MHPILRRKLTEVIDARHKLRMKWANAVLLIGIAVIAWTLWATHAVDVAHFARVALGLAGLLLVGAALVRWLTRPRLDLTEIAREIEANHPELHATLLTAIEQQPGAEGFGYMQDRVIESAVQEAVRHRWAEDLTARSESRAGLLRAAAAILLIAGMGLMIHRTFIERPTSSPPVAAEKPKPAPATANYDVEVTPGDVELEKGSRLVVQAKFPDDLPPEASLVIADATGVERQRIAMHTTVDAAVFGGMAGNIKEDGVYRVEFDGRRSKDFRISTFVHPELVRSDAKITPPDYAKQPVREIKNTLKVTALEGSQVAWTMTVNKPVQHAELFADKDHIIPLQASASDPTRLVATMQPDQTRKYRLHLVDDHERANKSPPWFHITVQANQLPKIEIAFPKRDARVSSLQELPLEAKVSDDVGVEKAGAVIELAEATREMPLPLPLPLSGSAAGRKFEVKTLLNLEPEKVEPTQLVSYYFWAEDKGPRGETRRAMSDMFFAEVRSFEDIFREQESPPGDEPEGEQKKSAVDDLLKTQKDIVNATWHLVRTQAGGKAMTEMKSDVDVVATSQSGNADAVTEAMEKVKDPRMKALLEEARKQMQTAVTTLGPASAAGEAKALREALSPEQRALRLLYQVQSNEHNVTKSNSKSKGQQGDARQREIDDLELKQKDQRYEEDKAAAAEKSAEQQENLAVLNRLKELARREEALAKKMKELEQQLAQAKTAEEREELQNQLKRLQDEQEQLLRDLDDTREKMEQSPNAANMADAKEQLDQTREKVNDALEQMKEQKLAQAGTAATRAQQELEKARDEFRQRTAKRFSEEMKAMRDAARDLETEQQKLADSLENNPEATSRDDRKATDTTEELKRRLDTAQAARQIDQQLQRAKALMEEAQRISEQAEDVEPLLHKHLYEAVRNAHNGGLEENLDEASKQTAMGDRNAAQDAERRAGKAIAQLKEGVEKAAEAVLGNESEGLRMARNELDKLIDEARATQQGDGKDGDKQQASADGAKPPKAPKPGATKDGGEGKQQTADAGKAGDETKSGDQPADKAGEGKSTAEAKQPGKADSKGQGDQKGTAQSKQPGKGKGAGADQKTDEAKDSAQASAGTQPGKAPGDPSGKGKAGEGKAGEGKAGEGDGQAEQREVAQGKGKGGKGQPKQGQKPGQANGSKGGGEGGDWFFDDTTEVADNTALTGDGFERWSDRLHSVEEMLSQADLRNGAAQVLDHARSVRLDARARGETPQAATLAARIINPLVELRDKVSEELARREGKNPLSPVDRDPVPEQYRELVRKYYEQLGAGK